MISRPLQLGERDELFAMECRSQGNRDDTCVIMLNAGLLDQTGPFRLHVQLSGALADMGVASLRVDLSGKGESAERAAPDHDSALAADRAAIEQYLAASGYGRAVLMGLCSGAMDAAKMASQTDRFSGLVLIDGFARNTPASTRRYYFRRLLRPSAYRIWLRGKFSDKTVTPDSLMNNPWPEPDVQIAEYHKLLKQEVNILAIYTRQLEWYYNHPGQLASVLAPCENLTLLDEVLLPDADHIFTTLYHRRQVIAEIIEWVRRFTRG